MSELRKEILDCIDRLPDSKLEAIKPLLHLLTDETSVVETDLTDEEREIIRAGRAEYKAGKYVPLSDI
ncbi:MAG: hypothetical protein IK080_00170, partial [Clostridia bacterium]|nr:hypothetical protein [Clostridia bacterium]